MNSNFFSRVKIPAVSLAASVVVAGAVLYVVNRDPASAESSATPVAAPLPKVTIAAAEEKTVTDYEELLGRVEAAETVEVRPRVSGHIEEVRLKAGAKVEKGEVLFVIDPRWYRAAHELAKAEAGRAKVRVEIAASLAKRSEALLESRAISVEEADTRTSKLAEAKAELAAAEAALENARLDLEHTEIRAPISGTVSRALVTAGNMISGTPGTGTLLATIVSSGDVHVYADVDEATWLAFSRLGKEGRIAGKDGRIEVAMELDDEDGFPHSGHVESADNRMDGGTGSIVLRMVFPDPEGLLVPGLSARVRLPVGAPEPKLFVSERSIGTNQNQKFVFAVTPENTVAYRSVTLGPVIDGMRVIRGGIQPGERIVTHGLQRVAPGMAVDPEVR